RRMERDLILKVLQDNHWNRRKSAEVLKISYRALLYKVREAGLPAKRLQRKSDEGPGPLDRENRSTAESDYPLSFPFARLLPTVVSPIRRLLFGFALSCTP